MAKISLGKRMASGFAAAVIASAMMVPAVAFADKTPDTTTYDGSSTATTDLKLWYDGDLGPTNKETDDGKTNQKVVVPAKIEFVAKTDGSIVSPSDVKIKNYSRFKVHVSEINVKDRSTDANGYKYSFAGNGTLNEDQVYLGMKPGSAGDLVSLHTFVGSSAATPKAGDWNIASAEKAGDKSTDLNLTFDTDSKYSSFSNITLNADNDLGQISWTVAPGHLAKAQESGSGD